MKRVSILFCLALSLAIAHADLVLRQNIQSTLLNGTMTTQIKGSKVRVDMPPSPQGAMSTIMDLNSGDMVTLLHRQKIAMKMPGTKLKQFAGTMNGAQPGKVATAAPKFHDTGRSERVNNYNAEIYTWSSPDGAKQTVWVAKNYPNYSQIKNEMDKLNNSPVARISEGSLPKVSTLPGMVVKTRMEMGGQTVISTLISAKQQPVNASRFEIPKNFQQMNQSGGAVPNH